MPKKDSPVASPRLKPITPVAALTVENENNIIRLAAVDNAAVKQLKSFFKNWMLSAGIDDTPSPHVKFELSLPTTIIITAESHDDLVIVGEVLLSSKILTDEQSKGIATQLGLQQLTNGKQ